MNRTTEHRGDAHRRLAGHWVVGEAAAGRLVTGFSGPKAAPLLRKFRMWTALHS